MNIQYKQSHSLLRAGFVLLAVLLAGCNSKGDSDSSSAGSTEQIEDFDLDLLHVQKGEPREPGATLGFARPPIGRIHARSASVGAVRGNEFELSCANGKVLSGVSGHYSNRIDRLQAMCVTTDDTGRWTDNPTTEQNAAGSNNGQAFSRVCPTDHAVVGFTSDFKNEFPAYMELHCRQLKATGLYGHAQTAIEQMGLVCYEDPAFAGRWSSRMDWPHIAIHTVMLSDGKLLTYGTGGTGIQGAMDYNVWDPTLGIAPSSHTSIQGVAQVDSFCSAATLLPDTGNVLISGGDARPLGRNNAGIQDAMLFNASSQEVSRANDMNFERWYPTSTTLPNGDILVSAGHIG